MTRVSRILFAAYYLLSSPWSTITKTSTNTIVSAFTTTTGSTTATTTKLRSGHGGSLPNPSLSFSRDRSSLPSRRHYLAVVERRDSDSSDSGAGDTAAERFPDIQYLRDDIQKLSRAAAARRPGAADAAANTLRQMLRHFYRAPGRRDEGVNIVDCNRAIGVVVKSKTSGALDQALDLLSDMIALYERDGGSCTVRPDVITYSSVINAYAQQGNFEGAMKVFKMQLRDFKRESNTDAKPNLRTFNTVINACSKSDGRGVPETAEKLLETVSLWHSRGDLEEGPDIFTYSGVINCWSKSSRPEAPQRALGILKAIILKHDETRDDSIRPDTITYSTVMDAYARRGNVEGANQVFQTMKDDFRSGNKRAKPNVRSYSILIDARAKSESASAPIEAESLLKEMIDLYIQGKLDEGPDCFSYTGVINCWSKSNRPEAPQRVLDILKTMVSEYKEGGNEKIRPNKITYSTVMDAYARQRDVEGANRV